MNCALYSKPCCSMAGRLFRARVNARRRTYAAGAPKKRFYKNVSVVAEGTDGANSYEVCLDGKKIKTSAGKVLKVPTEPLALAIAQEWDSQADSLNIGHMRLTGLAFTVLDNPLRIESDRQIACQILDYLDTDTVFYMAQEPERLVELQRLHWGELVKWTNDTFGLNIMPTWSLVRGPTITSESRLSLQQHLLSFDRWALTGLQYSVEALKSLVIVLAVMAHRLRTDDAVRIATLEQRYQRGTWGTVEWAHDIEEQELRSRLAAGMLFVHLTSNKQSVVVKKKAD